MNDGWLSLLDILSQFTKFRHPVYGHANLSESLLESIQSVGLMGLVGEFFLVIVGGGRHGEIL